MEGFLARIVPAQHEPGKPAPTRGTEVWVGDTKLSGVTGITMRADVDNVWRATIECHVRPPADVLVAAALAPIRRETWLHRLVRWVNGEPRDVTSLQHYETHWER